MQDALGIQKIPSSFDAIYNTVKDSFLDRARHILSEPYIREVIGKSGALVPYVDLIVAAGAELKKDNAAMLLICLLELWVLDLEAVKFSDYSPPEKAGLGYDFLHLFAALPSIPGNVEHLRKRGVPEDVIASTMREYDFCVELCRKGIGRPAFDSGRLNWMRWMIHNKLLCIGNLKFDFFRERQPREACLYKDVSGNLLLLANNVWVHSSGGILESAGLEETQDSFYAAITETETSVIGYPIYAGVVQNEKICLDRSKWQCILGEYDPVICVHIPMSVNLSHDLVQFSYKRAREIFSQCYPDLNYMGFYTHTWLLSPQLEKHLSPSSNILAFQKDYMLFPCKSKGQFVFSFVFGCKPENLEDLPENTSLQRNLKKLYMDGGYIHEFCGILYN